MPVAPKEEIEVFLGKDQEEQILKAYRQFGEKCVDHIDPEISFVVHDKSRNIYFAVRDPIGLSPLYYSFFDKKFYFSDGIGAILQEAGIEKEPDLQTMKDIVAHTTVAYDRTMYKNVWRLPPGHYMTVYPDGRNRIVRYWKPENIHIDYAISEREAKERFLGLLDAAIFIRIRNLETTAFEVSGGLDSSAVVAWVRQKLPGRKIRAFSMTFKGYRNCDETRYLDPLRKELAIDVVKLPTGELDYRDSYNLDFNYALNPYWPIFITYTMGFSVVEAARSMGIKTILTGQGGDQVLTGNYFCLYDYLTQFRWCRLYRELKASPRPWVLFKRFALSPMLSKRQKSLSRTYLRTGQKSHIMQKKASEKTSFREHCEFYTGNNLSFKNDLAEVTGSTLSALMENSYYHVARTRYGIEFFHPFFDRKLVEFMLTLPPWLKLQNATGKVLLRKAMKGILPETIRQRSDKAVFSEVLRRQIDAVDLGHLLDKAWIAKLGIIDQEKLDRLKRDYLNNRMKHVIYFWQILNLEYWYVHNFVSKDIAAECCKR